MKVLGFDIDIDSNHTELVASYLDAISAVMENPRISVEQGKMIVNMLIKNQLTHQQLYNYIYSQCGSDEFSQELIISNIERWEDEVGPFSKNDILYLQSQSKTMGYRYKPNDIPSIVDYISKRVIGQEAAIMSIVTAAWLHCASIRKNLGIKVPAQLLVGHTGVGKTQILNLLSEVLNIRVLNIYASTITAPGYKGGDSLIEQIFSQYSNCEISDNPSEPLLICLHEIDKVLISTNDGYRVELLSSIMSIIEKSVIYKSNPIGENQSLNLNRVLVLFDGCFEGIDKIVARRLGLRHVGFNQFTPSNKIDLRAKITKADLLDYGMMKEFVGRISNPICLQGMTEELMYNILTRSIDSPINTYISAFKKYGINLKFSTEALKTIANLAFENGIYGARSLETIVSELMQPYTLFLSSKSKKNILINKRDVYRLIERKQENFHS